LDDTNTDNAVLQQPDHGGIAGRHQGGEVTDTFLAGAIGKPAQQLGSESSALPVIDDGDGDFCSLGVFGVPDVASDSESTTISRVERTKRLVVVVVDLGEVTQLRGGQIRFAGQKSQLTRLIAEAGEAVGQQWCVPGLDLSYEYGRTIAKHCRITPHPSSLAPTARWGDRTCAVAGAMRSVVTASMTKGEVSTPLTALMDPPYLRFCRACNATHLHEMPFREAVRATRLPGPFNLFLQARDWPILVNVEMWTGASSSARAAITEQAERLAAYRQVPLSGLDLDG